MPKIVDKELMSQKIVAASLQAFVKFGFYNTSMAKIAKETGIAKGTLYLYFKSKEELINKITDEYFDTLKKKLIPNKLFEAPDMLLFHIKKSLLVNDNDSKFIPVFFEVFGPSFSSDDFVEKYSGFFSEVASFYKENLTYLQNKGLISKDLDPKYFGRALVSIMDGVVLHKGLFKIENTFYSRIIEEVIGLLRRDMKL